MSILQATPSIYEVQAMEIDELLSSPYSDIVLAELNKRLSVEQAKTDLLANQINAFKANEHVKS